MVDPSNVRPIGELIKARREQFGLSQTDVAEAVGGFDRPTVTRQEVARWERGKRIPRGRTRKAIAHALGLPLRLLDLAAAAERAQRINASASRGDWPALASLNAERAAVHAIRVGLLDHGGSAYFLISGETNEPAPSLSELRGELADSMAAYQASRYGELLQALPEVLSGAHVAAAAHDGEAWLEAQRILAFAGQAAAMVLTKLGELDLAWAAADQGLAAAQRSGDEAVLGSLCRSVVHTLQSHGRTHVATRLAESAADNLRNQLSPQSARSVSVYGTLLLAGAMAAARDGDRSDARDYLAEAEAYAQGLGQDANHLWTAFGPTNVAIHKVATSVAVGNMENAIRHAEGIDATRLPVERRVRYAFDLARAQIDLGQIDDAVEAMLTAEALAPEQVHHHMMSRQIISHLGQTSEGERNVRLSGLAQRVRDAELMTASTSR